MIVLNIYITIKNTQLTERIQYYNLQTEQLKKENKDLIDIRNNLIKLHLANIYQSSYINLQFSYLESKLNSRMSLEFYLNQILNLTPSSVQIDQIIFTKDNIQIQATTGNYSDIGYYIKELENQDLFTKIEYTFEPNDKVIGDYIVRNLNCKINLSL
jgi:Tfp pilus assembly protein PilN